MRKSIVLISISLLSVFCMIHIIGYQELHTHTDYPIFYNINPSYYKRADNGSQVAVYLDKNDLAALDYALRFSLDTEQEYNERIDDFFIKKIKAACKADDTCDLLDKVLNDFKGKKASELYLALGLRTDI